MNFYTFFIFYELFFLSFFLFEPLKKYIGDNGIQLTDGRLFFFLTCVLLLATGFYFLGHKRFQAKKSPFDNKLIFRSFVFLNLSLLLVWPVGSGDLFSYIYQNRVFSHHGENPYIVPYGNIEHDKFFDIIKNDWSNERSPYGPLFIILGSSLNLLGGDSLLVTVYLYKALFAAANIGILFLLIKIFKDPQVSFLYAFNPLIIFEFSINGHNDVLVILFFLLCIYFCSIKENSKKNNLIAILFFTLGALVKSIILVFAPFVGLYILSRCKGFKDKMRVVVAGALICSSAIFVFYFPFWEDFGIFGRLVSQMNQTLGIFYSPGILLTSFLLQGKVILEKNTVMMAIYACRYIFVMLYLILLIKSYLFFKENWNRSQNAIQEYLIKACFLSIAIFLFLFPTWLMPWYYCYLVILGLMAWSFGKNRAILNIVFGVTFLAVSYYFILR